MPDLHVVRELPHDGPGTHTLLIAVVVDDELIADPQRHRDVIDRVALETTRLLAGQVERSRPAARHDTDGEAGGVGMPTPQQRPDQAASARPVPPTSSGRCLVCDRDAVDLERHLDYRGEGHQALHDLAAADPDGAREVLAMSRRRPPPGPADDAPPARRPRRVRRASALSPGTGEGCGSQAGYRRHRALGEATCQPCRDAHTAYDVERRRRRREEQSA